MKKKSDRCHYINIAIKDVGREDDVLFDLFMCTSAQGWGNVAEATEYSASKKTIIRNIFRRNLLDKRSASDTHRNQ